MRQGRDFWWPRCRDCGRWLSWERWTLLCLADDNPRPQCERCEGRHMQLTIDGREVVHPPKR